MEKIDRLLSLLSYSRRVLLQLTDVKNLRHVNLIAKGFTPNRGHYFDFKKYGYKSYVNDTTRYLKTVFINYNNRDLMNDKYGCYLFLKQYTDKAVPVLGLVDNGKFYLLNHHNSIEDLLSSGEKFVVKERKGRGGEGLIILEVRDNRFYANGKENSAFDEIFNGLKNHIVNPYVYQHPYAANIYPKSLNTIRLLTCVLDDQVRVIRAGHRFGVERTGAVDNFSQGGIFANVDIGTGVLENPTIWDDKKYKMYQVHEHPNSKQPISGVEIPGWSAMVDEMIQLHQSMKFIKYVGWDVAMTANSFRIIEANYASDLVGLQLQAPLLLNEENRRFFKTLQ